MLKIVIHSHIKWIFPLSPYLSDAINTNKPRYENLDRFRNLEFFFQIQSDISLELGVVSHCKALYLENGINTKPRYQKENLRRSCFWRSRFCFYYLYCLIITLQSWTRLSVGLPDQRVCFFFFR